MFWGLVLKANKRYSQRVTKAFHVSQATLDLKTLNANDNDGVVQVWLFTDDADHLLANVSRQNSHVQLDLAFTEGETVAFYSKGSGTVHLSGYLLPEEDDDFRQFGAEEEGEEDEEESEEEEVELPSKKQKAAKKTHLKEQEDNDDEEEDDDDSDSDLDGLNAALEDEDLDDDESGEEEEDEDDEEDDNDEEEEDSDEEEASLPPAKHAKLDKTAKQNGLTNGKAPKQAEPKQKNQKQEKQELKHKNANQPQKTEKKQLSGGVVVEDIRVGKGPEAKSGKKVSVYYEGRLKSNNKVFDSTKSGEGFKFNLGRGEVIRGWDIGVAGMKVGSKRRITCPPNVAYGPKGAPPAIPGNATLVFEVELRGVN